VRRSPASKDAGRPSGSSGGSKRPSPRRELLPGSEREGMRFAIVGCGNISEAHIDSIKKIEGARLVAVWSRTASRAREVAAREGCDAVESLNRLVERDDVDIVTVCTPSGF